MSQRKAADERLVRLLGGPELADLRRRMRGFYERAPVDGAVSVMRITRLTREEHEAVSLLVGAPARFARSAGVDVARVDALLQEAGVAASLRDALEQLDGPIRHLRAIKAAQEQAWLEVKAIGAALPQIGSWIGAPDALGLVKRLSHQDAAQACQLLRSAGAVLEHLPASGLPLSQLAAEALGQAHGLDSGEPVAAIVLAVLRKRQPTLAREMPEDDQDATAVQRDERARDLWARAGVLVNELARPALALNLPVAGLGTHGPAGEPAYFSLRGLVRTSMTWSVRDRAVYVCENPAVVAIAADELGEECAPLVCTDGMPAAAQRVLLTQLVEAGARLLYHGDFDWPGLRIANHVMAAYQASPWRMSHLDYSRAVEGAPPRRGAMDGVHVLATWDPALTAAMRHHGICVEEEAVVKNLLIDLRS